VVLRPLLKQVNQVYEFGNVILIQECGGMLEIEDPDGSLRQLLTLIDGSRTADEIERDFLAAAPSSELHVAAALSDLDEAGVLINGAEPVNLDPYHLERFKRNLGFFETYASLSRSKYVMQEKMRDCKVTLLGLGGIGSHLALDLLGLGVRDLRVVDFDKIELSNLNRQVLYTEAEIGQGKVGLAVQRMSAYYPAASIEGVERKLGSAEDIHEMVAGRDFTICVIDRPKLDVHRWVNEASVRASVPYMIGGLETQRAMTFMVIPGVTGCAECWRLSAADDEQTRALRTQMGQRHGQAGVGPDLAAFGPLVTTATAMLVTDLVRFVTGVAAPVSAGRLMEIRFGDFVLREAEQWSKLPNCPVCAVSDSPLPATAAAPAR
jgi:molybdopterin/thiamine biosynthesis adenylyltransferase